MNKEQALKNCMKARHLLWHVAKNNFIKIDKYHEIWGLINKLEYEIEDKK